MNNQKSKNPRIKVGKKEKSKNRDLEVKKSINRETENLKTPKIDKSKNSKRDSIFRKWKNSKITNPKIGKLKNRSVQNRKS